MHALGFCASDFMRGIVLLTPALLGATVGGGDGSSAAFAAVVARLSDDAMRRLLLQVHSGEIDRADLSRAVFRESQFASPSARRLDEVAQADAGNSGSGPLKVSNTTYQKG